MGHPRTIRKFQNADGIVNFNKLQDKRTAISSAHHMTILCNSVRKSYPQIPYLSGDAFDADPELLGLGNGTKVDLRTGEITPTVATDYIQKICPHVPAPEGKYGGCIQIIKDILAENDEPEAMLNYMQELFGYFLSGDASQQQVYCFTGSGRNGKSVLSNMLAELLGALRVDSFVSMPNASQFMISKFGAQPDPDRVMVHLAGKRACIVKDIETGQKWSENVIKAITESSLCARRLYEEAEYSTNRCKVLFACNDVPSMGRATFAMQRRIVCIPFCNTFQDDRNVQTKLDKIIKKDISGLLRWAIDGRIKTHQRNGVISVPAEIIGTTGDYISQNDSIGKAISFACFNDSDSTFKTNSEIKECLIEWIQTIDPELFNSSNLEHVCSTQIISGRLRNLGFRREQNRKKISGKTYRGWYVTLKRPETGADLLKARGLLEDLGIN
jgi:putative DNA primase/helicase